MQLKSKHDIAFSRMNLIFEGEKKQQLCIWNKIRLLSSLKLLLCP